MEHALTANRHRKRPRLPAPHRPPLDRRHRPGRHRTHPKKTSATAKAPSLRRPRRGLHHLEIFATTDQYEDLITVMNTATNPRTTTPTTTGCRSDASAEGPGHEDTGHEDTARGERRGHRPRERRQQRRQRRSRPRDGLQRPRPGTGPGPPHPRPTTPRRPRRRHAKQPSPPAPCPPPADSAPRSWSPSATGTCSTASTPPPPNGPRYAPNANRPDTRPTDQHPANKHPLAGHHQPANRPGHLADRPGHVTAHRTRPARHPPGHVAAQRAEPEPGTPDTSQATEPEPRTGTGTDFPAASTPDAAPPGIHRPGTGLFGTPTGSGTFTYTGPVTASTIRKIACDADIIPVLLGSRRTHPRHRPHNPDLPTPHPQSPHRPRPRLRLPQLHHPRTLVRSPPHHLLVTRRTHQHRQRRPPLHPPPPPHPQRTMENPHQHRHPLVHPPTPHRPHAKNPDATTTTEHEPAHTAGKGRATPLSTCKIDLYARVRGPDPQRESTASWWIPACRDLSVLGGSLTSSPKNRKRPAPQSRDQALPVKRCLQRYASCQPLPSVNVATRVPTPVCSEFEGSS